MGKPLKQEQLKELVSITSEKLNIRHPAIIEKDYYVTHIIHSLSGIEDEYFQLIFAGGTCLAKAHGVVKRMSEDVDFKIQLKNAAKAFSKSRLLKELKKFRLQIISSLAHSGLTIGNIAVQNEGQYLRKNKSIWKERYHKFIETMVYDITSKYEYESAMYFLEDISKNVIDSL